MHNVRALSDAVFNSSKHCFSRNVLEMVIHLLIHLSDLMKMRNSVHFLKVKLTEI